MAITDINISEQLQTDAPSIKYTGNEGPQAPPQHQQEMKIAQQIWEALGPEQQSQFQSFEEFFQKWCLETNPTANATGRSTRPRTRTTRTTRNWEPWTTTYGTTNAYAK